MSFWNFLGEFAFFNMVCNWISGKSKNTADYIPGPYTDYHNYYDYDRLRQETDDPDLADDDPDDYIYDDIENDIYDDIDYDADADMDWSDDGDL